jgi:mannose-1-phosphate guanylyltransferase
LKAIILVGGKATRLLPLSVNTPKSLVPVINIPILEHLIGHIREHDIKEIVLAQGHLAQSIVDYFGDGRQFGVNIYHSYENIPLGSAGAAKNAEHLLRETFLVLNSDIFSDLDFSAMLALHRKSRAKATIATIPVADPTLYGLVESDPSGRVRRFLEKPKREEVTTNMINAGAWFVEADVLSRVPENTFYSFERNIFPQLLAEGLPVYAFGSSGYWIDMGTTEKYLQIHRDLLSGKSKRYSPPSIETLTINQESRIHKSARINGKVIIAAGCSIGERVILDGPVVMGPGCVIEDDTVIHDAVFWKNVRIGRGARITGTIIADNCVLEDGCSAINTVIGDSVFIGSHVKLTEGSKLDPGTRIAAPE